MTAGSEADGDSAVVDLPDIDRLAFSAHRGDDHGRVRRGHAVLFCFLFLLLSDVPGAGLPTASIVNYYSRADRRRVVLVGLYLRPFAGIAFIWFIVASTPSGFGREGKRSDGNGSPHHEPTAMREAVRVHSVTRAAAVRGPHHRRQRAQGAGRRRRRRAAPKAARVAHPEARRAVRQVRGHPAPGHRPALHRAAIKAVARRIEHLDHEVDDHHGALKQHLDEVAPR